MKITLAHGSGGKSTSELIKNVFAKHFSNEILNMMEDSAVVDSSKKIAVTTDSFVVTPLFYRGGNIGRLSICGTVNDLLMRGAVPKYITSAFIIEEGADFDELERIAESMAETAEEAGVIVVAGDTKVIEGNGGIYINTTGIGFVEHDIKSSNTKCSDSIILSGNLGDHHAVIMSERMNIENEIESDNAPLCEMVFELMKNNIEIHAMRDVTRGGLATVLCELAESCSLQFEIEEDKIPSSESVRAFCKILGLNLLYMGNEGKMVLTVPSAQAEKAVEIIRRCRYGENAEIIGSVKEGSGVVSVTKLGAKRTLSVLYGEGLPRIC